MASADRATLLPLLTTCPCNAPSLCRSAAPAAGSPHSYINRVVSDARIAVAGGSRDVELATGGRPGGVSSDFVGVPPSRVPRSHSDVPSARPSPLPAPSPYGGRFIVAGGSPGYVGSAGEPSDRPGYVGPPRYRAPIALPVVLEDPYSKPATRPRGPVNVPPPPSSQYAGGGGPYYRERWLVGRDDGGLGVPFGHQASQQPRGSRAGSVVSSGFSRDRHPSVMSGRSSVNPEWWG